MQIREFLTQNPNGIQADDSVQHAAEQMRRHNIGAIPVYRVDQLAGMLTDRDLVCGCMAAGHDASRCQASEHMTADPVCIGQDASIDDALSQMSEEQVRRLMVMDQGQVAGIVSLGDLAVHAPESPQVAMALARISQPVRMQMPV